MYRVRILRTAARELAQLDKAAGHRIVERMNWLAANLDDLNKLEVLTGDLAGLYKFRVGDYRIIYEIVRDEQVLVIHAIGHRREVYRKK